MSFDVLFYFRLLRRTCSNKKYSCYRSKNEYAYGSINGSPFDPVLRSLLSPGIYPSCYLTYIFFLLFDVPIDYSGHGGTVDGPRHTATRVTRVTNRGVELGTSVSSSSLPSLGRSRHPSHNILVNVKKN